MNTVNCNQPLFMIQGMPMLKEYLTARQNQLLVMIGVNPKGYTPHSYRSGGATSLALNGISEGVIQRAGAWKSSCYKRYIRDSLVSQAQVAKLFPPLQSSS